MQRQRKWQLFLILTVIALTVYNILPTLFYYSKPLRNPVTESQAREVAKTLQERVNRLEKESCDWIFSYCELLRTKPASVEIDPQSPQWIKARFSKTEDAALLRAALPKAGALIPFVPAQLSIAPQQNGKEVLVQRRIPIHIDSGSDFFTYVSKDSPEARKIALDRAAQVGIALGSSSDAALSLKALLQGDQSQLERLALFIRTVGEVLAENKELGSRYAASLTQGPFADRAAAVEQLIAALDQARDALKKAKEARPEERLLIEKQEGLLSRAENTLKKSKGSFAAGQDPLDLDQVQAALAQSDRLPLGKRNPVFSEVQIDLPKGRILLKPYADIRSKKQSGISQQVSFDEIAKISRLCNETIVPESANFEIALTKLPDATGFLVVDLEKIAHSQVDQLLAILRAQWSPSHPDLQQLLITDLASYESLSAEQRGLSLVICNPLLHKAPQLRPNSIYCFLHGVERLGSAYAEFPDSDLARAFHEDLRSLANLLQQNGYSGYPSSYLASVLPCPADLVFEKGDASSALLAATREDFSVQGTRRFAVLEFSDLEQRLLTENKIETKIHEDLLKWNDEYLSASVSLSAHTKYDVPKPTKNIFWNNLSLSMRKMVRGDEKKIIRWGLDLSGGKTVHIELRDANGSLVSSDDELKQGINELYNRVNKMGVSEVSIRRIGNHIVLDFPGSQALSASDLIQSSTMYFHVVNEKFSPQNPQLGEAVNRFLQEVWNQAVVSGKKTPQAVAEIAWKHLYGEGNGLSDSPRSEAARILLENDLRLAAPNDTSMSSALDDTVSKIAILRGSDYTEWHGQSHPLMIVFRNFALEGSQLENIHASYDPSKGNYLSFEVQKSSLKGQGNRGNPRDDLHAWTSRFSKERVVGTSLAQHSRGHGWRMAVLLNDSVINAPTLDSPLRDSAMISGNFSLREVQRLATDLKAGSLTFTPHILSEKNVSPELGQTDRAKGIIATVAALCLVIAAMLAYYRFAGLVSSIAVLFNLLIIWATLQNLGAALTLAGLAGVILTVAMAVDANVLVFERIKEEFAATGRIASAISAGYKKAYSAIIDSNVTTIIAALILLNFDAGPIKSFAVNLIIGIVSSLFTALFMTRFYFTGWAQNPDHKELKMADWIRSSRFDFLKKAKIAFAAAALIVTVGGGLLVSKTSTILGMDFTGGFALNLQVQPTGNEAEIVSKSFKDNGLETKDFQIRELHPSNHLQVLLAANLENPGKPFHGMPLELSEQLKDHGKHPYESNPRIAWVVESLKQAGVAIAPSTLGTLHSEWTSMSGQMSDSMKNNAIMGLAIAFAAIFVYLAFRFEYKFAAAALICVLHDVLITVGMIGILHVLGVPVHIDLNTVAAIMTIVGYSLNDTIIIFDRIREEMRLHRNKNLPDVVNGALNATLSRTTITSGTTLLVLLALLFFGGASIFSFALVMAIGVFFGTLSSWFIASPLMLFFHRRETNKLVQLEEGR